MQVLGLLNGLVAVLVYNCLEKEKDIVIASELHLHIERMAFVTENENLYFERLTILFFASFLL